MGCLAWAVIAIVVVVGVVAVVLVLCSDVGIGPEH